MDIHNLEQIKQEFSGFQQEFETGNKEKALEKLLELLDALEEEDNSRRAAQIDKDGNVILSRARAKAEHALSYPIPAHIRLLRKVPYQTSVLN